MVDLQMALDILDAIEDAGKPKATDISKLGNL